MNILLIAAFTEIPFYLLPPINSDVKVNLDPFEDFDIPIFIQLLDFRSVNPCHYREKCLIHFGVFIYTVGRLSISVNKIIILYISASEPLTHSVSE